ncbi:GIY-YIG nuclease family protein [Pelagibacterium halotolerans]|uniref:GIY-YIG nuclease family protein n=1 Tax=Pelagibacterium halotolerans TaxID=531813 RepID=UPI00384C8286
MLGDRQFFVYILTNKQYGTLYTGMTGDLARRIFEHRSKAVKSFSREHDLMRLVWYEVHGTVDAAYTRERRIKRWNRTWKIQLIEHDNPHWRDLTETLI